MVDAEGRGSARPINVFKYSCTEIQFFNSTALIKNRNYLKIRTLSFSFKHT